MNKITSFEEACKVKDLDPVLVTFNPGYPDKHLKSVIAFAKLVIIVEVLNEGWIPDWNNGDGKYYPWIDLEKTDDNPSGFSLLIVYFFSLSTVPSRLCFKSRKLAQYAFTTFEQLYKDYFLIE